jgi:Mg-chelatase subunit ChlD
MTTFCPQCQSTSPAAAQFCTSCGAPLHSVPAGRRRTQPPGAAAHDAWSDQAIQTVVQRFEQSGGPATIPRQTSLMVHDQIEHTVCDIDRSHSMSGRYGDGMTKLEAAIRANVSLILEKAQIDPRDHVGLVAFRSKAEVLIGLAPLSSGKHEIIRKIQSLQPGNGTDINEALKAADTVFDWCKQGVVRRIILLTDGKGGRPLKTAESLKSRGVVIDVIGVGPTPAAVDEKLLREVASVIEGESRYCFIRDQYTLMTHYQTLANKTATR